MYNQPSVAIIVLNWNKADDTIICVNSLLNLTYQNKHIFIIDNCSDGKDFELLQNTFNRVAHVAQNSSNEGYAGGNNAGLRIADDRIKPDYFWILNNDTRVEPDTLSNLIEFALQSKSSITGTTIRFWEDDTVYCFGGGSYSPWTGIDKLFHKKTARTPDYISGCSLLLTSEVYQKTSGFNPHFFLYSEEVELCHRAKQLQLTLTVAEKAIVEHHSSLTTGYRSDVYFYYFLRNKILLMHLTARWYQYLTYSLIYCFYYLPGMAVQYTIARKHAPVRLILKIISDAINKRWSKQDLKPG